MRCLLELPRGACGRLAYSVYGYLGCSERSARLAFNGQFLDGAMRGYFLGNGHRVYSPVLMRFNSPDTLSPFGSGGINAYAYCGGDPVNFSDPDGQTRFSNNPSVFDPIFASIRKKNYRVQGFLTTLKHLQVGGSAALGQKILMVCLLNVKTQL